jgi:glycosyltransferase involved in cell wall biosynthesis
MRVVILSKAMVRGAYQVKAQELAKLGVELTALVPSRWTEAGRTTHLERAFTNGYDLIEVPIALDGHYHVHFYPTLDRVLWRLRPDVFHVEEEPYNLGTFLAYQAGRRVGAKHVFFTWQNLNRRYPPPFRWMESWVLRHSDAAIGGNAAAIDVLRAKGYQGPATVVPQFGFDPALFTPATGERPSRPFTIGYLARFERQKGLLDLLEAAAGLSGDWRVRMVGYGPLEEDLRQRASALGIADRVEILPPVASTEVPSVYRGMDVVVLPSRSTTSWIEQFGRIIPEAWACGVPTIGSDSGEIPNLTADAGLIFPEGDVAALRAHLQRYMDDPGLRAEMARRGRARFLAHYTQEQVARATLDVYEKALGSRLL